jgi:putative transposase
MKHLQNENSWLKQLVAELSLDKTMLQEVLRKKWGIRCGAARWSSIWSRARRAPPPGRGFLHFF